MEIVVEIREMVASSSAVLVAAAGGTAVLALGEDGDALTSASHAQRRAAEGDSSQSDHARKTEESVANAEGSGRVLSQVADQLGGVGGSRKLEGSPRLDLGLLGQNKSRRRALFGNRPLFRRLQSAGGEGGFAELFPEAFGEEAGVEAAVPVDDEPTGVEAVPVDEEPTGVEASVPAEEEPTGVEAVPVEEDPTGVEEVPVDEEPAGVEAVVVVEEEPTCNYPETCAPLVSGN